MRVVLDEIMKITGAEGADRRHPSEIYRASASVARLRVAASKRAVDAFLDLLPEYSGLQPERIAFVVDGMRPSPALIAYQPSQRHIVLDERRVRAEDPRLHELTRMLAHVARRLAEILRGEVELRRTFAA